MTHYKEQVVKVGASHRQLRVNNGKVIDIFLNDVLFEAVEEGAIAQLVTGASFPGVTRVVGTPDLHHGYIVPIGSVVETEGVLLPTAAGYDISCGMCMIKTNLMREDVASTNKRRNWINHVSARVGLGLGRGRGEEGRKFTEHDIMRVIYEGRAFFGNRHIDCVERDSLPVDESIVGRPFEKALAKAIDQLGSLGSGNHFIEMQADQHDHVWIMLHTGSRGFGYAIADKYFKLSADVLNLAKGERDQVWMRDDSPLGQEYINHHNAAANFAICNRIVIAEAVIDALWDAFRGEGELHYEISHNLIQEESGKLVHRKGATRAFPAGHPLLVGTKWEETGHPILIPGSMETGSAILFARETASQSIYSVNHGAGRKLSRGEARRQLNQTDANKKMHDLDILSNCRDIPLDECGACYKDLCEVLKTVEEAGLARVETRLDPIANIKGDDK